MASFAFGLAMLFLTVAVPLQLHESYSSWIAAAWAVEGAVLVWFAVRLSMPRLQVWGLVAFGMAVVGLFVLSGGVEQPSFRPFFSETFWAFAICILSFYAAAYILRREGSGLRPWFLPAMIAVGSFLTVWLLSAEIVSYAGGRIDAARSTWRVVAGSPRSGECQIAGAGGSLGGIWTGVAGRRCVEEVGLASCCGVRSDSGRVRRDHGST